MVACFENPSIVFFDAENLGLFVSVCVTLQNIFENQSFVAK